MFKFTSNYILGALAVLVYASTASAAPSMLEARNADASVAIRLCIDPDFGHCIIAPVVAETCRSFTGGLSGYNKEVSSAQIPLGFSCTFFRNFACLSAGHSFSGDSVTLQGGDYPSFDDLPGDGGVAHFADAASSVTCSPV